MQRAADGMRDVIELLGHEDALVSGVKRRLGKARVVDVVRRPPREVAPMGASFEDVVLKVILVKQDHAAVVADVSEVSQPAPIPGIVPGQIVSAQTVPSGALTAAREGQLIKRWPDIAVGAASALVVIAPTVIPESIIVIKGGNAPGREGPGQLIQVIGSARSDATRHKPRDARPGCRAFGGTEVSPPPGDVRGGADEQLPVAHQPAIRKAERRPAAASAVAPLWRGKGVRGEGRG